MAMRNTQKPSFDGIPQVHDRAIRLPEVIQITGRSKTMIYADIKTGCFPAGFLIGKRARAWSLTSINEWLEQQKAKGVA